MPEENLYFEDRKVSEICDAENGQVGLVYEEGSAIPNEVMHKDEWEAGKSDAPNADRQDIFVRSSSNIQTNILEELQNHNMRFDEIPMLLDWLKEALAQVQDRVVNACYGTKDWRSEVGLDMLGDAPDLEGSETADSLAIYLLLKERGVKLNQTQRVMQSAMDMVNRAQIKKLETELGRPIHLWRMDDLQQYIELKSYAENTENPEGAEGQPGGEDPGLGQEPEGSPKPSAEQSA